MKKLALLFMVLVLGLVACNDYSLKIKFDQKFPKKAKNIKAILGKELQIKIDEDTVHVRMNFDRKSRLSTISLLPDMDTLYHGFATRYKRIIFISEPQDDSTFYITAMKLENNGIRGFYDWGQGEKVKELLSNDEYKPLIIDHKKEEGHEEYLLSTPKALTHQLFKSVLSTTSIDTIIEQIESIDKRIETVIADLGNENEIISSETGLFYPNPVIKMANIELEKEGTYRFTIYNMEGKLIQENKFEGKGVTLDLESLSKGTFIIKIQTEEGLPVEEFKFSKI